MGRSRRARALGLVVTLLTTACGPSTEAPTVPTPPTTTATARADAAPYEVHEWGLVRAEAGDVLNAGALAPPDYAAMDVDKPVLYFHTSAALELRSVRVHTPNGGELVEHWPPGVASATDLAWDGVALDPHGDCIVSSLPRGCPDYLPPGAFCETPSLAAVRTQDGACVTVPRASERFLFYRARLKTFTPPLRFTRGEGGAIEVENGGDLTIPGTIVRIWSDGRENRSVVALPPAPRSRIVVGHEAVEQDGESADKPRLTSSPSSGAGPEALRMSLSELGMTTEETNAFMDAWSDALFSRYRGADDESLEADRRATPGDSFVYFLPVSMIDGIATLTFDPPPRAVKRAFAVWSSVRASR